MIKISKLAETPLEEILLRDTAREEKNREIAEAVREIIANVRERGDDALREYSEKFDRAKLGEIEVSAGEIEAAYAEVGEEFISVMREAAENIRAFHKNQVRSGFVMTEKSGTVLGQKVTPLARVGLYVPGGTASYPSTVLMNAVPAKLAGVGEIVMVTPPSFGGRVNPVILAAAHLAGVDRVFKVGGAQAVAALAYGTQTVPQADKIVGPGNAYVAEAKRQVYGACDIDMIAGPSEILVIADESSDPVFAAADLLSQAEHDRMASAVLVTPSEELAQKVSAELERQIPLLERADIARESIDTNGKILITESIAEAVEVSNALAPEHLELSVENPFDLLQSVKNAGSVFLGRYCPESLGDYFAGPNHTLPTGGAARFASPLSVDDFVKKTQFTYYTKDAFAAVADKVAYFAEKEGLTAHARAAKVRTESDGGAVK